MQTASFGPTVPLAGVTADVVLVNDNVAGAIDGTHPTAGTVNDGCETPFTNAAQVAGHIALIDRGYCNFSVKVKNAQLAGAVAVLIANNVATGLPPMGGSDATITIPSYGITQALGTSMKSNLPAPGVNATLGYGTDLAGTNQGCVRMYAPNPVESGSSVSHFHSAANPSLLMEPSLNTSIFNRVDLTLPLFQDIDWSTNPEDILFIDGYDDNPCQHVQP